jgi:hypothetical protein
MIAFYFKKIYINKKETILVGQPKKIADKLLENFIFKTIDSSENSTMFEINRYTLNDDMMELSNVWTVLLRKDIEMLKYCVSKVGFASTSQFYSHPILSQPKMLGIDYVVYPNDADPVLVDDKLTFTNVNLVKVPNQKASLFTNNNLVPPITTDSYLFSENFYKNDPLNVSGLESLVLKYLNDEVINYTDIKPFLNIYKYMDYLEIQYYVPVLLLIIKDTLYNTYSVQ